MSASKNVAAEKYPKHKSVMQEAMGRLVKNKTAMLGFFILVIIALACIFANLICPQGYDAQNMSVRFTAPNSTNTFPICRTIEAHPAG